MHKQCIRSILTAAVLGSLGSVGTASPAQPLVPDLPGSLHAQYQMRMSDPPLPTWIYNTAVKYYKANSSTPSEAKNQIDTLNHDEQARRVTRIVHTEYWTDGHGRFHSDNFSGNTLFDGKNLRLVSLSPASPATIEDSRYVGTIEISPANTFNAGVSIDMIPLLGFQQPLMKQYFPGDDIQVVHHAAHAIVSYRVRHPYRGDFYHCKAEVDRLGRLLSLTMEDNSYRYTNFKKISENVWIPQDIEWRRYATFDIGDKSYPYVLNLIQIHMTSFDQKPQDPSSFTMDSVNGQISIVDHRFTTPRLKDGLRFTYNGPGSIDQASRVNQLLQIAFETKK